MNEVSKGAPVDHQNETEADSVGNASEDASHKVTTHSKLWQAKLPPVRI